MNPLNSQLRNSCKETVVSHLRAERSARSGVQIIRKLELLEDQSLANNRALRLDLKEDCRAGCCHCCYNIVLCRVPDVAAAVAYISLTFTEPQKIDLKKRLFDYERAVAPFFGLRHREVRVQCPLLVGSLCSIYPARPLRCRAVSSLDVQVCEDIRAHPEADLERPLFPGDGTSLAEAQLGTSDGLAALGLATGYLDFGRALAIALESPAALDSYFSGGHDLAPAYLRKPISKQPRIAASEAYYPEYKPGDEAQGKLVPSDLATHFELFTERERHSAQLKLRGPSRK